MPGVRTPYVKRAPGRLHLQCTSLMLSVLAHTLLPFSNSVLSKPGNWSKLTINTFTGMCPAMSCGFLTHPEILVSPLNRYYVAI